MFDQFKQMASLLKNAGEIRERAGQLKETLKHATVDGEAGGGAVRVELSGDGRVLRVRLAPALLSAASGDPKMAEELIASAFNDGAMRLKQRVADEVRKASDGLDIPGMEHLLKGS